MWVRRSSSHALGVNIDHPWQTYSYCYNAVSGGPNVDWKFGVFGEKGVIRKNYPKNQ
jgi:hypothetical protein